MGKLSIQISKTVKVCYSIIELQWETTCHAMENDGRPNRAYNVLGTPLQMCSIDPITGFYRDGCCNTGPQDRGLHMICCVMTDEFLQFSKDRGNDLSTPMPQYGFPGLEAWRSMVCMCLTLGGSV